MNSIRSASAREMLLDLTAPVYWPIFTTSASMGMLIPVLPLYLRDLDLSFTSVSVILAAAGLGGLLGGLPAGSVMGRIGAEALLALSVAAMVVTSVVFPVTTLVLVLIAFRFVYGLGSVGVYLSRQTFVTEEVVSSMRGTAMSFTGGALRLGVLVGPLLGGALTDWWNYSVALIGAGVVAGLGWLPAVLQHPSRPATPSTSSPPSNNAETPATYDPATVASGAPGSRDDQPGLLRALWRYKKLLLRGGMGPMLALTVRDGRFVVLPLVAAEAGLSPGAVGVVVAIGTAADLCCFPLSGILMDRFGRLFAIVPAFLLMAVGFLLLGASSTSVVVAIAGVVIGIGNGIGAGTMLTLGSDLAPADTTGHFLAGITTMSHTGRLIGPLVVGMTADAVGLSWSSIVLGGILVVAVAWIVLLVGETANR